MPPLTYLSDSAILRYLPIDKRRELSKKIPYFRAPNRKIPYRLNTVSIRIVYVYVTLSLDNYYIKYTCVKGNLKMSTPENTHNIRYSNDDALRGSIEIRNKLLKKILKYFFNRPGTSVDSFSFLNWDDTEWCQQKDFNDIKLKIGTLVQNSKMDKQCNMELFKNSHFSDIHCNVYELEDIERIKSFNGSRNAQLVITVYDSDRIDLQSLIDKLNDNKMKCSLKLDNNLFYNFLGTLKTSRSYPLGFKVKSFKFLKQLTKSQLKDMGGMESFVMKDYKIHCYTFSTSDPQKEVIVTWEARENKYDFVATVQEIGTSVPCTPVLSLPVNE